MGRISLTENNLKRDKSWNKLRLAQPGSTTEYVSVLPPVN